MSTQKNPHNATGRLGIVSFAGATLFSAFAMTAVFFVSAREAGGAVPDCASGAANIRTWIGGATGNWGTAGNWSNNGSQPPTPGADEIACIGDANVTLDVAADVDAIVSRPNGTLTMTGWALTLSPPAGEESLVANLAGSGVALAGAGDLIVTKSINASTTGAGALGGTAGSKLTLAPSVGTNANVGSLSLDRRTLFVSDGVTVTQSAGASVSSNNGGSVENSGVWNATGDGSVFSPGTAPGIFHNTATGVVLKTGGTSTSTRLNPFDNDGLIENQTTGTINLEGGSASSSDGSIVTGPGRIAFNIGTYTIAGDVSGAGTVRVNGIAIFTGSYAVARTETGGGGSLVVFDTPSPQTLPQLVAGTSTSVDGSADLVVTERLDCNSCTLEGPAGSQLTLADSVGTNATLPGVRLDGRTLVVENGVTVSHSGITSTSEGGSVVNHGTWNTTGTFNGTAPSVFRNMATGILRRPGAAGDGASHVSPRIENDGLIENLSTGTLKLGRFPPNAPGKISVGDDLTSNPPNTLANATLSGSGRLSPDVVHGEAIIAPGSSPGTIEVVGAPGGWQMLSSANHSRLAIEIGGTGAGQFDKLLLAGPFAIGTGTTLALSTLSGYTPAAGDQFEIVKASSVTGSFGAVTGTDLGGDLRFQVVYEASRVLVRVLSSTSQPPDAVADTATVAEDSGATTIDVLANDTDPNGDALTIMAIPQPPANGTVAIAGDGLSLTYTPNANFNGNDPFTYRVQDPQGNSDTATVTVTVTSVNDPPDARDDTATVVEDSGANAIGVLANDTAAPDSGETLTITAVAQGTNGSVAITGGGSGLTYDPNQGFVGSDSFTYTISDGNGGSDTATVDLTVSDASQPPDAVDDAATVAEDSGATAIDVLANDSDPNGDALTITAVTQGTNGTVAITGGGSRLTYEPNPNFNGDDSFTYTISDGDGGSGTATVRITVESVNDPPDAVDDSATVAQNSAANAVDVLGNDGDPEDDALTITAVTQGTNGAVAITGGGSGLTYDPNQGYHGPDSFTYTISDGNGGSDTAAVTITVTAAATGSGIVFVRIEDGNSDIYVMNDDGSGQTRLTTHPDPERNPAWSPDRTRIAFTRATPGNWDIYVMNADGSGQTRLTSGPSTQANPTWSPNGTQIAFVDHNNGELFVMNADGSGLTRLSTMQRVFDADWSPDGTKIAVTRRSGANTDVWVVNADGTGASRLTTEPGFDGNPRWSPDGSKIAFNRWSNIWTMNPDGSGKVQLIGGSRWGLGPIWSPDGSKIAFWRFGILVMNADGSGEVRLTSGLDAAGDW